VHPSMPCVASSPLEYGVVVVEGLDVMWQAVRGERHRVVGSSRSRDGVVVHTACGKWLDVRPEDARSGVPGCPSCVTTAAPEAR
jgi:hypothetical protein